jgi:maltose alpha-D-glucosyltransferase/alpha-amylase
MQWSSSKNLGFSKSDPKKLYLPVDTAKDAPNVEAQEKKSNSLLNRTRKLIQLKHTEPEFAAYSEFIPLFAKENTYPFIYARAKDKDIALVILNPSGKEQTAVFKLNVKYNKLNLLAGKEVKISNNNNEVSVTIPGRTFAIYKLQ